MKQAQLHHPGVPADVVTCVDVPEPVATALDDVLVAIDVSPMNSADLLTLQVTIREASLVLRTALKNPEPPANLGRFSSRATCSEA